MESARVVVSRSNETTFDEDIAELERLEEVLQRLTDELCEGLRAKGRPGRTIGIKVRLRDFTTVTRARTLDHATDDPSVVGTVARELLRAYDPPQPVRLLGVRVAGFAEREDGGEGPLRAQLRLGV